MKKLFSLVCLVVLLGISANLMAQSTGIAPYPGATHTYTSSTNVGTYLWTVTKGDLTTSAGTDAVITGNTAATASIAWAGTVVANDVYYVHVKVTNSGCTNEKVMKVTIAANQFKLAIAATNATGCYNGDVVVSLNATLPEYSHGTSTITYTVTATNNQGTWRFNYANTAVPGYVWGTPTVTAGTATVAGNLVTVTGGTSVTLQFVVTNNNIYNNTNDALGSAADFTSAIQISSGQSAPGFTLVDNGQGTYNASTAISRPHTTTIVTP